MLSDSKGSQATMDAMKSSEDVFNFGNHNRPDADEGGDVDAVAPIIVNAST